MKTDAKTPLDDKTLLHFKELLLAKRKEAAEQVNQITRHLTHMKESGEATSSSGAYNLEELAADNEEITMNYQFKERTTRYIQQIDEALNRIENGTYGICMATGKVIARERLEMVPHTQFSIDAKKSGLANDH